MWDGKMYGPLNKVYKSNHLNRGEKAKVEGESVK